MAFIISWTLCSVPVGLAVASLIGAGMNQLSLDAQELHG